MQNRAIMLDTALAHPPLDAYEKVAALYNGHNPHFQIVDKVKLLADQAEAINLQVHKDVSPAAAPWHTFRIPAAEMLLGHRADRYFLPGAGTGKHCLRD